MTSADSPVRRPLTDEERRQIFYDTILPSILTGDKPATNKTAAFVCGQPGSGKSTTVRQLKNRFGGERTICVSTDDYFCSLPGVNEARMAGESWRSGPKHEEESIRFFDKLVYGYIRENDCHFISESCFDPSPHARYFNDKGYNCEKYLMATDKLQSVTSMFERVIDGFNKGSMANCGVLDKELHDDLYAQWPKLAYDTERSNLFNRLVIMTREGEMCYDNTLQDNATRQWAKEGSAHRKLIELRNRHFSEAQIDALETSWNKILESDLAQRDELRSYPLSQYRDEVMVHARSPGKSFDARHVLPQDRREARNSYITNLTEDIYLMDDSLGPSPVDTAFQDELREIFKASLADTKRKDEIGKKMLADINRLVAEEKSADRLEAAHALVRLGMKADRPARIDHETSDLARPKAVEPFGNDTAGGRKRPASDLDHMPNDYPKRARYDERPADQGRGR